MGIDKPAACDHCHRTCVIQTAVRVGHETPMNICLGCLHDVRTALGTPPRVPEAITRKRTAHLRLVNTTGRTS